jgi:hypothetical protein
MFRFSLIAAGHKLDLDMVLHGKNVVEEEPFLRFLAGRDFCFKLGLFGVKSAIAFCFERGQNTSRTKNAINPLFYI